MLGHDTPGVVEVKRMYVRLGNRGKGAGMALMRALIDHARGNGVQRIVLDSHDTMQSAHKIYRAAGFRDARRHPQTIRTATC